MKILGPHLSQFCPQTVPTTITITVTVPSTIVQFPAISTILPPHFLMGLVRDRRVAPGKGKITQCLPLPWVLSWISVLLLLPACSTSLKIWVRNNNLTMSCAILNLKLRNLFRIDLCFSPIAHYYQTTPQIMHFFVHKDQFNTTRRKFVI